MSTYFVKFQVVPTEHNLQYALVEGAFACCWIVENSEISAYEKARFYVSNDEWAITRMGSHPFKVTQANFEGWDIGVTQYLKAQDNGIAIVYAGWSCDGKTSVGPMSPERSRKFDLNGYIGKQKRLSRRGRCLHFDSGSRCGKFISAHSMQKNGQLSGIADDGHVYTISMNIGALKKNNGRFALEKRGINNASTFLGFCDKHDGEVFSPIDTLPLLPIAQVFQGQILLYAYRSVCRELFVKENAVDSIESQIAELPDTSSMQSFFESWKAGTSLGLENLRKHKATFDDSLRDGRFSDIDYVLLTCRQKPVLAFSGLLFPEFDFQGRQLQDLSDPASRLDLLTFCSAPMQEGWGFLFAWHKTSSKACNEFMRSLATVVYHDGSVASDAMFRLVVSNCENLSISPSWWDGLLSEQRNCILECITKNASPFAPTTPEYLLRGLEGICQWCFESVHATMPD